MIRRINLLGGPGSGKSTTAARLFGLLKINDYDVELVTEFVKLWTYENKVPDEFDQLYLFGQQMNHEKTFIKNSKNIIVTDSPLLQNLVYTDTYKNQNLFLGLRDIYMSFTVKYPELNIFINRKNKTYKPTGRFGDFKSAKEIDKKTKTLLSSLNVPFIAFDHDDIDGILEYVQGKLK